MTPVIPMNVLTLIVPPLPGPSVLVLQPAEDMGRKKNSRVIPIWVGAPEAAQLELALDQIRFNRPMTHDLFLDALTNLDTVIERVVIDGVKGSTFFAKLHLRQGSRAIVLDARPSDAVALALRERAPIFVVEEVLEKTSFPYLIGNEADEAELAQFREFITHLAPEDFDVRPE